jgi:hypothetical protein
MAVQPDPPSVQLPRGLERPSIGPQGHAVDVPGLRQIRPECGGQASLVDGLAVLALGKQGQREVAVGAGARRVGPQQLAKGGLRPLVVLLCQELLGARKPLRIGLACGDESGEEEGARHQHGRIVTGAGATS